MASAEADFATLAKKYRLQETTIHVLHAEGLDSTDSVSMLTSDDIGRLDLNIGERHSLTKWMKDLRPQSEQGDIIIRSGEADSSVISHSQRVEVEILESAKTVQLDIRSDEAETSVRHHSQKEVKIWKSAQDVQKSAMGFEVGPAFRLLDRGGVVVKGQSTNRAQDVQKLSRGFEVGPAFRPFDRGVVVKGQSTNRAKTEQSDIRSDEADSSVRLHSQRVDVKILESAKTEQSDIRSDEADSSVRLHSQRVEVKILESGKTEQSDIRSDEADSSVRPHSQRIKVEILESGEVQRDNPPGGKQQDITNALQYMPEDVRNATEEYIKTYGFQHLDIFLQNQIDDYKTYPINIAVTGASGAGKSSWINAIRGLKNTDKGAAKVGVTETTMKATPYAHPDMSNLLIWDLPGLGTDTFKRDEYIKLMKLDINYDALIICYSARVGEEIVMIAKAATEKRIPYYIVRTKIDQDIDNAKEDDADFFEEGVLHKIRHDIQQQLLKHNLSAHYIYLISIRRKLKWDYPTLVDNLIKNVPPKNHKAMVLSLMSTSTRGILLKNEELEKEIPIVVAKIIVQKNKKSMVRVANEQVDIYANQFGLTEQRLIYLGFGKSEREKLLPSFKVGIAKGWRVVCGLATAGLFTASYKFDDEEKLELKFTSFLHQVLVEYAKLATQVIQAAIRNQ